MTRSPELPVDGEEHSGRRKSLCKAVQQEGAQGVQDVERRPAWPEWRSKGWGYEMGLDRQAGDTSR